MLAEGQWPIHRTVLTPPEYYLFRALKLHRDEMFDITTIVEMRFPSYLIESRLVLSGARIETSGCLSINDCLLSVYIISMEIA